MKPPLALTLLALAGATWSATAALSGFVFDTFAGATIAAAAVATAAWTTHRRARRGRHAREQLRRDFMRLYREAVWDRREREQ